MLHHCLSAEHVLVNENNVCKVFGFGFAEDVRDREDYGRKQGVPNLYVMLSVKTHLLLLTCILVNSIFE